MLLLRRTRDYPRVLACPPIVNCHDTKIDSFRANLHLRNLKYSGQLPIGKSLSLGLT